MASLALDPAYRRMSVEEFLEIDFNGARAELEDGIIFMMAGGTPEHALVAARIIRRLGNALDGSGCEPVGSDMGVRTAEKTVRYPDVSIYCDPVLGLDEADRSNPRVIIEVLSPPTADHDHKVKLLEYQALPGVEQIMLIDPVSGATRSVIGGGPQGWSDRWLRGDEDISIPSFGIAFSRTDVGIGQ